MASSVVRRPLPALISLVALLLLTGIVWWRVMNRGDGSDQDAASCPTPSPSSSSLTVLPAPASVTLQVLNSTSRNGLAATVRADLQQIGFKVPGKPGNDNPKTRNPGTAQIRFGPGGKQAATLVRYYFPGAALVATRSTTPTVVVAVGDKYRRIASSAAVDAAMKKDDVTVRSASPGPTTGASSSTAC